MKRAIIGCCLTMLFISCSSTIKPEDLYGEWKYVSILDVYNPSESTTAEEIAANSPSINFDKNNKLVIIWGGKPLSHGKFKMEGKMIRYTENLPGGKFREFPFLVSKLTKEELIFETMDKEAIRVTARRIK